MTTRLMRVSKLALLGLLLAPIAVARAQRFEIAPFAGAFVAPTNIASSGSASIRQQPGFALGARGTWWGGAHYGLEGTLTYVRSNAKLSATYGETQSATLGLTSVRLAWRADSAGSRMRLSGGLAAVNHGGEAYGNAGGRTDVAVALGAGWRVPMGGRLAWRVDLDDYLYTAKFTEGAASTSGKIQSDLLLSVGLAYRPGR